MRNDKHEELNLKTLFLRICLIALIGLSLFACNAQKETDESTGAITSITRLTMSPAKQEPEYRSSRTSTPPSSGKDVDSEQGASDTNAGLNSEETTLTPTLIVTYTEIIRMLSGNFSITVENIEGAAYFKLLMYKSTGEPSETKAVKIDEEINGTYVEGERIDIIILDATQKPLHTFKEVDVMVQKLES